MDYSHLDPQQVLDALDAVGLRGDGRVLQLNSYENRVFQVFLEDGSAVVAKFYRPGRWSDAQILEEHTFALELAAAEVPVVPPLELSVSHNATVLGHPPTLAKWSSPQGEHRFTVATRCAGREPELESADTLRQIGRFIGRLHAVGRQRPFVHRHHLNPALDGERALQVLLASGLVPDTEKPAWQQACQQALVAIKTAFDAAFDRVSAFEPLATLRLHGDCHIGNLLWRGHAGVGSPHMVDLDDAMQGPAVQDLWMLVSGDAHTLTQQLNTLLQGYEQFCEFDDRERALIEPLRTLRMLRHSAWLAQRWGDPMFPRHFPFFASAAYWNQQTAQLREQLALMQSTGD
jgi:Ser/Thr protein kinase RdoA (MazF antagonist)